jgi:hypothetical protein
MKIVTFGFSFRKEKKSKRHCSHEGLDRQTYMPIITMEWQDADLDEKPTVAPFCLGFATFSTCPLPTTTFLVSTIGGGTNDDAGRYNGWLGWRRPAGCSTDNDDAVSRLRLGCRLLSSLLLLARCVSNKQTSRNEIWPKSQEKSDDSLSI